MKFTSALLHVAITATLKSVAVDAQGQMVKMCLFYGSPSGHARSDPIIDQQCASGHVHTFYGPQEFHPDTTYEDLIGTPPEFSTSPFVENQSLYWHPSIYEVTDNEDGTETFTRVDNLDSSPYYRWDNSVSPKTEAFPPGFRLITASSDAGANNGGENGENMFTECCNFRRNGSEDCISWNGLEFPTQTCDFLGIALAMPTCWNGELGDTNDHKNHMAYTLTGEVAGECPQSHPRRLPEIQLFVRIPNYKGGKYQLSDGNTEFHFDFMNGWSDGKLQEIIDNCSPQEQEIGEYNPPCDCTAGEEVEQSFLTPRDDDSPGPICDNAVRRLILNEATDVTTSLPKGACQGPPLIPKSWDVVTSDLYTCEPPPTNPPPTNPAPTNPPPTNPAPTNPPPTNPAPTNPPPTNPEPTNPPPTNPPPTNPPPTNPPPTNPPPTNPPPTNPPPTNPPPTNPAPTNPPPTNPPPTNAPPTNPPPPEESSERWVVCGRGVRDGLKPCREGEMDLVSVDEVHEVRCCVYEDDFGEDAFDEGWRSKCRDEEFMDVLGKSVFDSECFEEDFYTAYDICHDAGGRLCSADEVLSSCTKGTGCRHDKQMIWTCTEEYEPCEEGTECCTGICNDDGECQPW